MPFCSGESFSAAGDTLLVLLLGELESKELSERPFVSEGEASREVLAEKTGPSSKLLTGRIEAIRLGVAFEPLGTEVEGRWSVTGIAWCVFESGTTMPSRLPLLAFVVPGDAELRLCLGDLVESSEARLDATESAVPGRLEDSLLRVSLFDLGENISFLMMGDFLGVDSETVFCPNLLSWATRLDLESCGQQVNRSGEPAESNHEMPNDMQWVLTCLAAQGTGSGVDARGRFGNTLTYP